MESRPQEVGPTEEADPRIATRQALLTKFKESLTLDVAGSSRSHDPVASMQQCIGKLVEVRYSVLGSILLVRSRAIDMLFHVGFVSRLRWGGVSQGVPSPDG